jgi:uncharacterized protein
MSFFDRNIKDINKLCDLYHVNKLFAFGSAITDHFTDKSDVDILVDLEPMPPIERGESLMKLWDALEALFSRRVDLLTDQSLRNPYLRDNIDRTKKLIYERGK